MGMELEFDYANIVVMLATVATFLFFEAVHSPWLLVIVVAWVPYTHVMNKYCHLRACARVDYNSVHLGDSFCFLLGIPLAMVAALSAHWAGQLRTWQMHIQAIGMHGALRLPC